MAGEAAPSSHTPEVAVYRLPPEEARTAAAHPAGQEIHRWNEPLLWQNAVWFCRLRWAVVVVLAAAGVAGLFPDWLAEHGLRLDPDWPLATAVLLGVLNTLFTWLARRPVESTPEAAAPAGTAALSRQKRHMPVRAQLWTQIVCDLLVLTAVVHWLGSGLPAAPFMYLFHIILACIVFPPWESLLVVGVAASFYVAMLWMELTGLIPTASTLVGPAVTFDWSATALLYNAGAMFGIWLVIWYLVSRLAAALRRRERELALTNLRLQASSEERAKHMLETTHQLKAPFAAIHAQTQLLLGGYCGALPPQAKVVVEKISARCMALSRQIQTMLQLANLRSRGQTAMPRETLDVTQLIEAAVARVEPTARQRQINITPQLEPAPVRAVSDHLTMLLDNLLVNAVNYSYDGGQVEVTCRPEADWIVVSVRDHGIGIPADKLPHIFDDYYRTEEAVKHNRTSSGLGLAIVRHVAREAGVELQVESAPGWGTRFTVRIPRDRQGKSGQPGSTGPARKPAG